MNSVTIGLLTIVGEAIASASPGLRLRPVADLGTSSTSPPPKDPISLGPWPEMDRLMRMIIAGIVLTSLAIAGGITYCCYQYIKNRKKSERSLAKADDESQALKGEAPAKGRKGTAYSRM